MQVTRGQFGAALGIATLGPTLFSLAGTEVLGLREKATDPESRHQLRIAQVAGTVTLVGLGLAVGLVIDDDDYVTVAAAVGAAALMCGLYEYALRHPKGTDSGGDTPTSVPIVYG